MTRYFVFGSISFSFLLMAMNSTAIAVAFPVITDDFQVSLILAGWVLTINNLAATACMPLGGKAGEIFGIKNAYLFALTIFTVGSLVCALSPNMILLIFGRFLQAVGHGMMLPLSTAIVGNTFSKSRQQSIGFFTSLLPVGNIIGPIMGGWMVESFGWRSMFWLYIPLSLIMFFVSLKIIKAGKGEGGKIDLLGIGYFTGALSAFLIAINTLGNIKSGGSWLIPGALFLVVVILLMAFLRRESRVKNPVMEPYFLGRRPFLEANIYSVIFGMAGMGVMNLAPLFVTSVYDMTTLESGLLMVPRAIGMVLAAMITSYLLPRWGYRWPILAGTGIITISIILLGLEPSELDIIGIHFSAAFLIGSLLLLIGIGMGILNPAMMNVCIDIMPERIGMITGLRGMFRQSGGAVSLAVSTLMLHYFQDMGRGFSVIYFGLAILLIISIPFIFLMPKSPNDQRWIKPVSLV